MPAGLHPGRPPVVRLVNLDRIVTAACELVGARYGALGVVGADGKRLVRFITHGVTGEEIAATAES